MYVDMNMYFGNFIFIIVWPFLFLVDFFCVKVVVFFFYFYLCWLVNVLTTFPFFFCSTHTNCLLSMWCVNFFDFLVKMLRTDYWTTNTKFIKCYVGAYVWEYLIFYPETVHNFVYKGSFTNIYHLYGVFKRK